MGGRPGIGQADDRSAVSTRSFDGALFKTDAVVKEKENEDDQDNFHGAADAAGGLE